MLDYPTHLWNFVLDSVRLWSAIHMLPNYLTHILGFRFAAQTVSPPFACWFGFQFEVVVLLLLIQLWLNDYTNRVMKKFHRECWVSWWKIFPFMEPFFDEPTLMFLFYHFVPHFTIILRAKLGLKFCPWHLLIKAQHTWIPRVDSPQWILLTGAISSMNFANLGGTNMPNSQSSPYETKFISNPWSTYRWVQS